MGISNASLRSILSLLLANLFFLTFAQDATILKNSSSSLLNNYVTNAKIPGVSFAEIKKFEILRIESIGVLNTESGTRVDENSIFEGASLTKPIVAYCAMKMVEQKILDLDRPLFIYFNYADVSRDQRAKLITTRMVLSHTSGLPNWRPNNKSEFVNLEFEPNTKFNYSGEGFVYLQKVMEHLLKSDLNQIAHTYIFNPLKMRNTSLVFDFKENFATGHDIKNLPGEKFKSLAANAAYSLHTTGSDYAKFLIELVSPKFINKKYVREMIRAQVKTNMGKNTINWGLGLGLTSTKKEKFLWHWGDNNTFKSFFIINAKTGNGFTYFSNSENGLGIIKKIIKLVLKDEDILKEWIDYHQL